MEISTEYSANSYLTVLKYWRNVEFFRVFDFEQILKSNPLAVSLYESKPGVVLPWKSPESCGLNPDFEYSYDCFFSPFLVSSMLEVLSEAVHGAEYFLPDYRAWELPGRSCTGRIGITSQGFFDLQDLSLSTLPWAVNETVLGKSLSIQEFDASVRDSISGVEVAIGDLREATFETISLLANGFSVNALSYFPDNLLAIILPIKLRKKKNELAVVSQDISPAVIDEEVDLDSEKILVDENKERIDRKKKRKVDILNSFFLRDLERIAGTKKSELSLPLQSYFSDPVSSFERFDLRNSTNISHEYNALSSTPLKSRWPSAQSVTLSTGQNAAINWILKDKSSKNNESLIGVNGPPGTGKTTIIKDLVASLVVKRAEVLSRLKYSEDAFIKGDNYFTAAGTGREYSYRYRKLIHELSRFGVVIASNNNGAVENISKELPTLNALSEEFKDFRYCRSLCDSYTYVTNRTAGVWWGLISVPLGKASNRKRAIEALIWGSMDPEIISEREKLKAFTLSEMRKRAPKENAVSFKEAQKLFLKSFKDSENSDSAKIKSELFLSALTLHEAWIREVPRFEAESKALGALLKRPSAVQGSDAQNLWAIFSMISPIISTTFASVERMFGNLSPSALPFVVIDEAGQAVPQSAAGLLLRAERALVLGDQKQLLPIVPIPEALDLFLQTELTPEQVSLYGMSTASIQSIADCRTKIGIQIGDTWMGLPLTEHRRCDDPMYSLSNKIAYDNIMSFRTPKRDEINSIGESCWIDVKGSCSIAQWVPDQGNTLKVLLQKLLRINNTADCFFISPFRSIKAALYPIVKEVYQDESPDFFLSQSLSRRIGTIHTFQGREADIVFLILGCDHSKQGAADWAGATPHLCNVAITRAKRRLYVLGDVDLWHRRGVFSDLQKGLPVKLIKDF